jgi:putative ABC transport system permease protein
MNKFYESVRVAVTALLSNKLRALLTTIGIGIGIASVIILVSLGESVQAYVAKQFLNAGTNLIYVRPVGALPGGQQGQGPAARAVISTLTDRDLALLQDTLNVPNVRAVVPLLQLSRTTDRGTNQVNSRILATNELYFDTLNRSLASGRLFDDQDVAGNARVAVIGQTTLKNLFPEESNPIGQDIRVGGVTFKVVGTLQKFGGSSFGVDQDDMIVIPLSTAQTRLQSSRSISGRVPLSTIYLQADSDAAIDSVTQNVTELMRNEHKIKPGDDDDFQVTTQRDLLKSFDAVIGVLTVFLSVIGGISLIVGGIGVMNIMLVTVTERTREIGLRKAVGARASDILSQFLTEATVLCFVGAIAGLIVAFLFIQLMNILVADLAPVVSIPSVFLAAGVTTMIGLFFGLYPASRAAQLNPIQALRAE